MNFMKCIHTAQIHEYNKNKTYPQYKQHKASMKNTRVHLHTSMVSASV